MNTKIETKRYAVTIDMYVYAANDAEAREGVKAICGTIDMELDNNPRAKKIVEIPFGSLEAREVKLN